MNNKECYEIIKRVRDMNNYKAKVSTSKPDKINENTGLIRKKDIDKKDLSNQLSKIFDIED